MKTIILIGSLIFSFEILAEIKVYKETENEGMDRHERFASIEKYLMELGNSINKLELKLGDNSKMVKILEGKIEELKIANIKKTDANKDEKPFDGKKIEEEMKKLKDDFISIKNKDIESIKADIHDLKISQRILEGRLH